MPYADFIANATLQEQTPLIPATLQAPQTQLVNYSNTPHFSTQPINFANTNKTSSSELQQPTHTVSNINDTPQNFSLILDTSLSDPLSSQFSSPTPSQVASNPFKPPHGQNTNIESNLSQAHWNHSFNIDNSLHSFQSSKPLRFQGTPLIITLKSNSPTSDHHSRRCLENKPIPPKLIKFYHRNLYENL